MDIERYYGGVEMVQPIKSQTYPLLPLRGTLVFPYMVTPLEVGRVRSIEAVEQTMLRDGRIVLALSIRWLRRIPAEDIYDVGTVQCSAQSARRSDPGFSGGISRVNLEHIDDAEILRGLCNTCSQTVGEMDRYEARR